MDETTIQPPQSAPNRCPAEKTLFLALHWCTLPAGHEGPHVSAVTNEPFEDRERCPTCKRPFEDGEKLPTPSI
jgi:hypothetical protein